MRNESDRTFIDARISIAYIPAIENAAEKEKLPISNVIVRSMNGFLTRLEGEYEAKESKTYPLIRA